MSIMNTYTVCTFLVLQSRTDLEQHSVEGSSTSDSVSFITFVQSLKRKLKNWEKVMEVGKNFLKKI